MPKFENRQVAIEKTLIIESLTSKLIKHMMGLDLHGNTKTLDNKSSSISLRAKIDLLMDCGKLDKLTYINLSHIMSIRNQFAHNFECDNFEDLPKFIDGIDKPLLKYCPEKTSSTEENLKNGFLNMIDQAFQFLRNEFRGVTKEFQIDASNVKIYIKESEQKLLDQYGIHGPRNRALVLNKIRQLLNDENGNEGANSKIHNEILKFKKENPNPQ
ncbi:hypothetical protein [Polluticaenibacter yanchengensis]|uniref:DUF4145 domain-containing protein n=1 Tax=Polluticaenibacter yanchengensis TaxID=3014562 RepID=A0ABT4UMB8_9BACT|nr:hypothetical protein [Chitinophagaceae bacterium LY-5]